MFCLSCNSVKKIKRTSYSSLKLTDGLSCLILFISRTSFSIKSDIANSFLMTSESLVGTKTALSTSTLTILSWGTAITLWTAASLSKSVINLSIKSMVILNSGFDVLKVLN